MSQKKYTFSLDESLVETLKEVAKQDYRSLSSELEYIIAKFLESRD